MEEENKELYKTASRTILFKKRVVTFIVLAFCIGINLVFNLYNNIEFEDTWISYILISILGIGFSLRYFNRANESLVEREYQKLLKKQNKI